MKAEKSVIVAIFVFSIITTASVTFGEPGHSFGQGYGYGMDNSQSPSGEKSEDYYNPESPHVFDQCMNNARTYEGVCLRKNYGDHAKEYCASIRYNDERSCKETYGDRPAPTSGRSSFSAAPTSGGHSSSSGSSSSSGDHHELEKTLSSGIIGGAFEEVSGTVNAEMGKTAEEVKKKIWGASSSRWDGYLSTLCRKHGSGWSPVSGSATLVSVEAHRPARNDKDDSWCSSWEYCGTAEVKGRCRR